MVNISGFFDKLSTFEKKKKKKKKKKKRILNLFKHASTILKLLS